MSRIGIEGAGFCRHALGACQAATEGKALDDDACANKPVADLGSASLQLR